MKALSAANTTWGIGVGRISQSRSTTSERLVFNHKNWRQQDLVRRKRELDQPVLGVRTFMTWLGLDRKWGNGSEWTVNVGKCSHNLGGERQSPETNNNL